MKIKLTSIATNYLPQVCWISLLLFPSPVILAQQAEVSAGEQVFQTYCAACHSIGAGRLVGPDLIGVHDKRTQPWLEQFVKSAQSLFDSGDADAAALFAEYSPMIMPDSAISDQQIGQVLLYIQSRSSGTAAAGNVSPAPAAVSVSAAPPSMQEVAKGADLFQGRDRFENSGPACNACHGVRDGTITSGGSLAVDLTSVYSRMGAAGLSAIIAQAPFPAMQVAYTGKPVTAGEIASLVAYFQSAEVNAQSSTNYGLGLLFSGLVGAAALFVLFPFIWRNRKKESVNQSIYDRQNRTE